MEKSFKIYKAETINKAKWQHLIENSAYSNPFQTETFYSICKKSDEVEGFAYAIENQQKKYEALCVIIVQKGKGIKEFFSRRAIVYGGPVLSDDCSEEALQILLTTLKRDLHKKAIYIEIRNYANYRVFHSVYERKNWNYIPYLNIKVDLNNQTLDSLLLSFKYNRRREIKLTLKAGLTYKMADTLDQFRQAYIILSNLYKQQVGLPIPSFEFFTELWRAKLLKVFVVMDKNKVVGGSFCTVLKCRAIYTYYYCGLRNYKPKTYPTHLAVLAAMDYGINNQLKYLDFMGCGTPDKDYGVRKYKKEFGGQIVEEGRFLKVTNHFLYWLGAKAVQFLKKKN